MDLAVGPALQVGVDVLDLVHLEPERAPRRHAFVGSAPANCRDEQLLRGNLPSLEAPAVAERHDGLWGERGAHPVFAMTAGAIELVLLPALIRLLRDSVARRRVVGVVLLLSPRRR